MSHFIVTYIKEDNKYALFSVNSSFAEEEKQFRSVEEAKDFPLVSDVFLPFSQYAFKNDEMVCILWPD